MESMRATNIFTTKVLKLIHQIPKGKIATYGQIAKLAGKPQGSRGVAWILHSCSVIHELPWHRVVNSKGKISFPPETHNYRQQKRFLQQEGVLFLQGDRIDLTKFQWKRKASIAKLVKGRPRMFTS